MASERQTYTVDGYGVALEQLDKSATAAAHADDYVLAELLKLAPFDGSHYAKVILPWAAAGFNSALLSPQPGPGLTIWVTPFRAIIGTRVAHGGTPTSPADPVMPTADEQCVRDIRSAVFAVGGASSGSSAPVTYAIPPASFTSNSSGNPRWDLIYVTVTVDAPTSTVSVLTKPASGAGTSAVSAADGLSTTVGLPQVLPGTPAGSPTFPATPADTPASGLFNIALGYVLIPNGFVSSSSTITKSQIATVAPCGSISERMGAGSIAPASFLFPGGAGALDTVWGAAGARPDVALPSTMRGKVERFFNLDAHLAAGSAPVPTTSILDNTCDWRKRYFLVFAYADSASNKFASDPTAADGIGNAFIPGLNGLTSAGWGAQFVVQMGQSFHLDMVLGAFVCELTNTLLSAVSNSGSIAVYVDMTSGALKLQYLGTPGCRLFLWVQATGAADNV